MRRSRKLLEGREIETDIADLAILREKPSLTQKVELALAALIYEGRLKADEILVEQDIADYLGVSRTPLRHAMQRLESDGLLRKRDGRSYQVRKVDLKEYLQSLKVRELLEPEAAALSIGRVRLAAIEEARRVTHAVAETKPYDKIGHWRADDIVHRLFIANCGNDVLAQTLMSLRTTTQLFEIERLSDRLGPDCREHLRIMDALQAGDQRLLRREVSNHIRSLIEFVLETVT